MEHANVVATIAPSGVSRTLAGQHAPTDVSKLGIPIRMLLAFNRFTVCLQAITTFIKKPAHRVRAHREAMTRQLLRQRACALAGPAQWRHRITTRTRVDESLQRFNELRLLEFAALTTTTHSSVNSLTNGGER